MANEWRVDRVVEAAPFYITELEQYVGCTLNELRVDDNDDTVLLECGDDEWWFHREWLTAVEEAPAPTGNPKYNREIKPGVFVDVYDVLYAFKVTDPCLQHLIKKALAAGQRGHKDARQDLVDIRDSAQRALDSYDLWEAK